MANSSNGAKVAKLILSVMGLGFLAIGGVLTLLSYNFMDNALPATGTVVSVEVNYGDDSVTYQPTVRYMDHAGRKQTGETFISSSSYDFEVGAKVNILYDVRDPASLRMNTWFATWGFGVIFLFGALVPFVIATIIGVFARQKARNNPASAVKRVELRDQEEEMIEVRGRTKGMKSRESRSDHERETSYTPTVRRRR